MARIGANGQRCGVTVVRWCRRLDIGGLLRRREGVHGVIVLVVVLAVILVVVLAVVLVVVLVVENGTVLVEQVLLVDSRNLVGARLEVVELVIVGRAELCRPRRQGG